MQAIGAEFNYSETTFVLPPTVRPRAGRENGRMGQPTKV
jgi:predicted PhzF superfamily epimerase YddE/YHI9